ncbi:MAG: hypothetical protein R2695_05940 [Acidimicrobiales bacterium]
MAAPDPEMPHPVALVAVFVADVALGIAFKSVFLNWIVGPLFLVITLFVVPSALSRLRRRGGGGVPT